MNRHWLASAAVTAVMAATVAGCGAAAAPVAASGTATGSATTVVHANAPAATPAPSPSQAAYITEADKICGLDDKAFNAANALVDEADANTPAGHRLTAYGDRRVAAIDMARLNAIRELPVPAGASKTLDAIWGARATAINAMTKVSAALLADDNAKITALSVILDTEGNTYTRLAARYGFKVCGSGTSSTPTTTAPKRAATPAKPKPKPKPNPKPRTFAGNGTESLGTIRVTVASAIDWTCDGCSTFGMDSAPAAGDVSYISIDSQASSGTSQIAPGTYGNVQLFADGTWTVKVVPDG
jgi:hypothetical protein